MGKKGTTLKAAMERGDSEGILKDLHARTSHSWVNRGRLYHLDLSGMELTELPEELTQLKNPIQSLSLQDNKLKALPEVVRRLTGLLNLNLRGNKITALPDWIGELTQLETLSVLSNGMQDFPEEIFGMPSLQNVIGVPKHGRGEPRNALETFLRRTGEVTDRDKRLRLWRIFRGEGLESCQADHLAEALRGKLPELVERAEGELKRRSAGLPVGSGCTVVVLGSVDFKKTDLKKGVVARGASYAPHLHDKVTHVVLGRSPKEVEGLDQIAQLTYLSQDEARALLDATPEVGPAPELDRVPAVEAAHVANLNQMLVSADDATVDTALEMVKKEGIAEGTLTRLFVVAKLHEDAKIRGRARKLLKRLGSPQVQKAIADRDKLAYTGDKAEQKTAQSLRYFQRLCPEIDWVEVSLHLRQKTRHGLSYALQAAPAERRLEILRGEIFQESGGPALDFYQIYSPGYSPYYLNSYSYYSGWTLPAYLYDLVELQTLRAPLCLFDKMSPGIARLKNLKVLDLSANMLSSLPDELEQLTGLREVHLGMNAFGQFPPVLERMPWLTHVDVQGNRAGSDSHQFHELTVPAHVRQAMPGCTFVDGLDARQRQHAQYYP